MKRKKHACRNAPEQDTDEQVRCCCGKLLAKQTDTGIVLKCTRCKREIVIAFLCPHKKDGEQAAEWREGERPVRRLVQSDRNKITKGENGTP